MLIKTKSSLQDITLGFSHKYLPIERKSIFKIDGSFKQPESFSANEIRYQYSESAIIKEIRVNGTIV